MALEQDIPQLPGGPPRISRRRALEVLGGGIAAAAILGATAKHEKITSVLGGTSKDKKDEPKSAERSIAHQEFQPVLATEVASFKAPEMDLANKTVRVGFPLDVSNGDVQIEYDVPKGIPTDGTKTTVKINGVEAGSKIYSPVDGYAFRTQAPSVIWILNHGPEGYSTTSMQTSSVNPLTEELPLFPPTLSTFSMEEITKGIPVKLWDPLFEKTPDVINTNNPDISISFRLTTPEGSALLTPNFLQTPSGSIAIPSSS